EGESATGKGKKRFSPRQLLVAGQVALSLLLLIGATLLTKSLVHLYRVDAGFQPNNLLTMHVSLPPTRYDTAAKQAVFYEQTVERLESVPGVRSAAISLTLPFTGWAGVPVQLATGLQLKLNEEPISIFQPVTRDYFRSMKIALKRGREFNAHDTAVSAPVAIIMKPWRDTSGPNTPTAQTQLGSTF